MGHARHWQNSLTVVTTRESVSSPVIPFKNEMAMELLEKGRVRVWTQVEKCTSACQVDYVFNDVILSQGQVGIMFKNSMSFIFSLSFASTSYDLWIEGFLLLEIHNELRSVHWHH